MARWGDLPLVLGLLLVVSSPVGASAVPGNVLTGWVCPSISGQVVACELHLISTRPPVGDAPLWLPYPLADFVGMTTAELERADSLATLRVMLDVRQESSLPVSVPGGIRLSTAVVSLVGPDLGRALGEWLQADGLTEGLADGQVPPVPGYGTPPGPGQRCWWREAGLPVGSCDAPPATIDSGGRIQWPAGTRSGPEAYLGRKLRQGSQAITSLVGRFRPPRPASVSAVGGVCQRKQIAVPCVELAPHPGGRAAPIRRTVQVVVGMAVLALGVGAAAIWHRQAGR